MKPIVFAVILFICTTILTYCFVSVADSTFDFHIWSAVAGMVFLIASFYHTVLIILLLFVLYGIQWLDYIIKE